MATNKPGALTVHFKDGDVYCNFDWPAVTMLEDRLGMDVLAFLSQQKGTQKFLQEAIFCGAVKSDKTFTPNKAGKKLAKHDGDLSDLQKEVLYAIARGKPENESRRLVAILDDAFDEAEEELADSMPGPDRPTPAASGKTGAGTSGSQKRPQSA
jgi:hypothetical protein